MAGAAVTQQLERAVQASSPHFPHLTALRAFAVMGPMILHLWPANWPDSPLTPRLAALGFLGVDLFFVISGFLITGILLAARDEAASSGHSPMALLRSFYMRRALRIVPVYWLTLLVLAGLNVGDTRDHLGWNWLYATNFLVVREDGWFWESHFWSLAVEEQFYLLWPFLVVFLKKDWLLPTLCLLAASAPLSRWLWMLSGSEYAAVVLLPSCLDVLCLGAILAVLWRRAGSTGREYRLFVRIAGIAGFLGASLHVIAFLASDSGWLTSNPLARTSFALLFVAIVAAAVDGFRGVARSVAEFPPIVYAGTISYGAYLFHPFVGYLYSLIAGRELPGIDSSPLPFVLLVAGTFGIAAVSWEVLEKPVNRLRHRFPYVPTVGRDTP